MRSLRSSKASLLVSAFSSFALASVSADFTISAAWALALAMIAWSFGFGLAYGVFLNLSIKGLQIFCHRNLRYSMLQMGIYTKNRSRGTKTNFFRFLRKKKDKRNVSFFVNGKQSAYSIFSSVSDFFQGSFYEKNA